MPNDETNPKLENRNPKEIRNPNVEVQPAATARQPAEPKSAWAYPKFLDHLGEVTRSGGRPTMWSPGGDNGRNHAWVGHWRLASILEFGLRASFGFRFSSFGILSSFVILHSMAMVP